MDEVISFALLMTLIVALVAFGLVVLVALAVAAAVGAILFYGGRAILRGLDRLQEEIREDRRRAKEAEALRLREQRAEAIRQEVLQQQLAEARAREEKERERRLEESAARDRLEAERLLAIQTVLGWNQGLFVKQPSAEDINTMVEQSCRLQAHSGRYLLVTAAMGRTGIALEWKAHIPGSVVPQVIAHCDQAIMFREWAFAGRHSTMLSPGRHVLEFFVERAQSNEAHEDLSFEVFIPEGKSADKSFDEQVNTTVKEFVDRSKTLAAAKREVRETLESQGADPEEIEAELGRFEGQIHAISED